MKRKFRCFVITAVLILVLIPTAAFAAGTSVSLSGSSSVKAGDTVTMTVKYAGSSLGYVNGGMTYDTDKLEYISGGSSQGDGGYVQLKTWADDASGKLTFKVKFKALKAGNADLDVSTSETQNLDGESLGAPSASKSLKIAGTAVTGTTKPTETQPGTTEEKTTAAAETTTAQAAESSASDDQQNSDEQKQPEKEKTHSYLWVGIGAVIALIVVILIAVFGRKSRKNK